MMESYVNWKHYTMDNKVFFRIIIPTYNVEELLPRCLDSVFN